MNNYKKIPKKPTHKENQGVKMKRTISLFLSLILILGVLCSAISCTDVNVYVNGEGDTSGGGIQPDSSLGDDTGTLEGDLPTFIENGNQNTDYESLKPEARALLSTVRVLAHFERYLGYGQTSLSKYKKESSGIIYRLDRAAGDAYVITNFHSVYHKDAISSSHVSDNIELFLYGQESAEYAIPATYVGGSLANEIAVLKVSASEVLKHSHALPAVTTDSNDLRIFDEVFAMGNPEGLGLSVTNGIVSVENDSLSILGADGKTTIKLRVIRTSAPINEGNSGGGLFTEDGKLCGIVVAKKTGDDIDNIAYAIPSNLASLIADILIENYKGTVTVGFKKYQLGITMSTAASGIIVDEENSTLIKEELIKITAFAEGSALASFAELEDIITSITVDGKTTRVTAMHNVIEAMLEARLGSIVTVTLLRGEETITKTLTVTESMLLGVA